MDKELYDLVIEDQYDCQDERSVTPNITDTQAVETYRRNIGEKGHQSPSECSPDRYKVTRNYEMVFVKNGLKSTKSYTIGPVLDRITKRRLDLGLRKIREIMLWESSYEGSESISHYEQKPKFIKRLQEGLDDLSSFFKRKKQMLIVLGFIKLGFQQKQLLRRSDQLANNLEQFRAHQVFVALKDNVSGQRSRAVQTLPLFIVGQYSQSAIHPVDLSGVNVESVKSNSRPRKVSGNPFWKVKPNHVENSLINMEDQKDMESQVSFQTINIKLKRLQSILDQAQQIKKTHLYRERLSTRTQRVDKSPILFREIHSQAQIGSLDALQRDRSAPYGRFQQKSVLPNSYLTTNETTNSIGYCPVPRMEESFRRCNKTIIHNIIQPVIQHIIQPVYYYHVPHGGNKSGMGPNYCHSPKAYVNGSLNHRSFLGQARSGSKYRTGKPF